MAHCTEDSTSIAQMKRAILKDLTDRYRGEQNKFQLESTALDLRFWSLHQINERQREEVLKRQHRCQTRYSFTFSLCVCMCVPVTPSGNLCVYESDDLCQLIRVKQKGRCQQPHTCSRTDESERGVGLTHTTHGAEEKNSSPHWKISFGDFFTEGVDRAWPNTGI